MSKLEYAAKFLRTISKKDGEMALKELKILENIKKAAQDISECPYIFDDATLPKAGIDAAPQQVVLNLSVGYIYWKNLQAVLKEGEPVYVTHKCECNRLTYYQREFGYKCLCGREVLPETN